MDARAYVSGQVFGQGGTNTFTASLADGCTVVIKMNDFTANEGSFMTATLTDPEGKAVVLNGDGSVSASCRRDTVDHDADSSGLALPNENNVAVVSRGSVVKHYPDGRANVHTSQATPQYMPEDASWYDMNGSGVRRAARRVQYDQYKRPEPSGSIPTASTWIMRRMPMSRRMTNACAATSLQTVPATCSMPTAPRWIMASALSQSIPRRTLSASRLLPRIPMSPWTMAAECS